MKKLLTKFFLIISCAVWSQEKPFSKLSEFVLTPEFMLGISADANEQFPERDLQKQYLISFGRNHFQNPQEWAHWLNAPKTGLTLGYTDLGNATKLGSILTLMPFIEFNTFGREQRDMKVYVGMGASYFNVQYDPVKNPFNQAVTTDLTWSFRTSFLYRFLKTPKADYRIGLTYAHHSNGHTRLPNQGLNSFLGSLSVNIKNPYNKPLNVPVEKEIPSKSTYDYFSFRGGSGRNVLALSFNDKKYVYTVSGEYGKVWNKTYKLGLGFYYRYYEHYFDYINNNESLVQDEREFDDLKSSPVWNASALGVHLNAEVLLNHVGVEVQLGANIFKPAYRFDWRINEGWDNTPRDIPLYWQLGEYTSKFKMKHVLATRMGLKYYLWGTNEVPKHNLYLGAHINANGGQADFTEVSVGYVYSFNRKDP